MIIKEKLNLYVCEHGCHNVTVDVDKGVTPFMIDCVRTGDKDRPLHPLKSKDGVCTGIAKSSFYPRQIDDSLEYPKPKHEWYRPDLNEYSKLNDYNKEHVKNGGLLLRPRTDKEPILHSDDSDYKVPDYDIALKELGSKNVFGKKFF